MNELKQRIERCLPDLPRHALPYATASLLALMNEEVRKALKGHENCIVPKSWEESDPSKPGVNLV